MGTCVPDLMGNPVDIPVIEVVTTTRREEARTVMAMVSTLLDRGVAIRDIAIVVRNLNEYEAPLDHAGRLYGITPAYWTQLNVIHTQPFALLDAVCTVLGDDEPSLEVLCRPLEYRWCPPSVLTEHPASGDAVEPRQIAQMDTVATDADSDVPTDPVTDAQSWPIEPATLQSSLHALPAEPRSLEAWLTVVEEHAAVDTRLKWYLEWLIACRSMMDATDTHTTGRSHRLSLSAETIATVLTAVLDGYEALGLPVTQALDSAALVGTARDARAVVRLQSLISQVRAKYSNCCLDGWIDDSWIGVAALLRRIATELPGRRELSNARAIDVFEANDLWLLDIPYVIAMGLLEGEWPRQAPSTIPVELQSAILRGEGRLSTLPPHTAWSPMRDYDQFLDTVRAASSSLILTRYTQAADDDTRRPSPLIDQLESTAGRHTLDGTEAVIPDAITTILDAEVDDVE